MSSKPKPIPFLVSTRAHFLEAPYVLYYAETAQKSTALILQTHRLARLPFHSTTSPVTGSVDIRARERFGPLGHFILLFPWWHDWEAATFQNRAAALL